MGFIRNIVAVGLGFLALRAAQRMIAHVQEQQEKSKVRAKTDDQGGRIPTLRLDPATGEYRPEA